MCSRSLQPPPSNWQKQERRIPVACVDSRVGEDAASVEEDPQSEHAGRGNIHALFLLRCRNSSPDVNPSQPHGMLPASPANPFTLLGKLICSPANYDWEEL